MTNAERISKILLKYGKNSLHIHTVPQSPYWLVFYQTEMSKPNWRVIVCNPERTNYRMINNNVTPDEYVQLWEDLIKIKVNSKDIETKNIDNEL